MLGRWLLMKSEITADWVATDSRISIVTLPTLLIGEIDIVVDVELYVMAAIEKHQRLKGMPDSVKSRIKLALVKGAHGM